MQNVDPDADLEERIQAACDSFKTTPCRQTWQALCELVKQRSPQQVERMECAMRLR